MPARTAHARWEGTISEGDGTMALGSGAFEGAYSFKSRFEEGTGTNPEELIAAAHAGCFSMALSKVLGDAGHEPTSLDAEATVHLTKGDAGPEIGRIELELTGVVPGIDEAEFTKHAETAKENCPVSKVLAGADISLTATLEG